MDSAVAQRQIIHLMRGNTGSRAVEGGECCRVPGLRKYQKQTRTQELRAGSE